VSAVLDAAIELAAAGFRVFPVWGVRADGSCQCHFASSCGSPGKHPHGRLAPRGVLDATDAESRIAAWWRQVPACNVGLATGAGLLAVDADGAPGIAELAALWREHDGLHADHSGAEARTGGGGLHLFFAYDESLHVRCQQAMLLPGGARLQHIDVRGEGGYVVAPPSSHASGSAYQWVRDLEHLGPAPSWLLAIVAGEPTPSVPVSRDTTEASPPTTRARPVPPPPDALPADEIERVRAALVCIPPTIGYGEWCLNVGGALHDWSRASEQGFQLFHEWSRRAASTVRPNGERVYKGEADCRLHWRSFSTMHRDPKTIASLHKLAAAYGHRPAPVVADVHESNGHPLPIVVAAEDAVPWREPEPLARNGSEYVQIDIDRAFPPALSWLCDFVVEVARLQQVPVEFPALLAIGAAAGACGNVFQVRLTGTGWVEPAAIWTLCAFESGGGKSPVYRAIAAPFHEWETAARADDTEAWRKWQAAIAVARAEHERAKRRAQTSWKKAEDSPVHRDEMNGAVADTQARLLEVEAAAPMMRGVVGSDFTTEAMVEFLERHGGRCLILDPEGSVFGHALDASSLVGASPWVKGFSAEPIQQDRVGRGRLGRFVQRPCLSMAICTQVSELRMLADDQARQKGFAWRFLPAVFHRALPERALVRGTVPEHLAGRWAAAIQGLLELPIPSSPATVELGIENVARLEAWLQSWLDRARLDPAGEAERVVGWGGSSAPKIHSYALRLAMLFHVLSTPDPASRAPSADVLDAVLGAWMPYLVEAVERTMGLAQDDPDLRVARRVLEWIARRGAPPEFSRPAVFRDLRSGSGIEQVARLNGLNSALTLLTDAGWIQPADKLRPRGAGTAPAASRYLVHPDFVAHYARR